MIASLQNITVLTSIASLTVCVWKFRLRVSHAILFFGALFLFFKHGRFIYEFILLCMPLVRHAITVALPDSALPRRRFAFWTAVSLVVLPFASYSAFFSNPQAYPFGQSGLPIGNVAFLNGLDIPDARVLNEPNTGGYLEWALNGRYKIFSDMQMSIFSDEDFFFGVSALSDDAALSNFCDTYSPHFISIALERKGFAQKVLPEHGFVLVFFDDAEALYASKTLLPRTVEQYGLKDLDPFSVGNLDFKEGDTESLSRVYDEALRVVAIHPSNMLANSIVGRICLSIHEYERALAAGQVIVKFHPDKHTGYALVGHALLGMGRYDEALANYRIALKKGSVEQTDDVYKSLLTRYNAIGDHREGYAILVEVMNPYRTGTDYRDIFQLAMWAFACGKSHDGTIFFNLATLKAPKDDLDFADKAQRFREKYLREEPSSFFHRFQ